MVKPILYSMKPIDIVIIVSVAVVTIVACTMITDNNQSEDTTERIGIIGAMDTEITMLKEAMDIEKVESFDDITFYSGKLAGRDVVLVKCGMGKVNAGICTLALITTYNAKIIINSGVAGSLDNRLDIEDIVISSDAVQHDFDVSPIGFKKGEIPYTGKISFEADKDLRKKAVEAIEACASDIKMMEGRVCTGDQFISSDDQKSSIIGPFGGLCCDMEGGAIAQVCYLNDIPFVLVRAISDKADGSASEDYEEFEAHAAKRSAAVVKYMIEHM